MEQKDRGVEAEEGGERRGETASRFRRGSVVSNGREAIAARVKKVLQVKENRLCTSCSGS